MKNEQLLLNLFKLISIFDCIFNAAVDVQHLSKVTIAVNTNPLPRKKFKAKKYLKEEMKITNKIDFIDQNKCHWIFNS